MTDRPDLDAIEQRKGKPPRYPTGQPVDVTRWIFQAEKDRNVLLAYARALEAERDRLQEVLAAHGMEDLEAQP